MPPGGFNEIHDAYRQAEAFATALASRLEAALEGSQSGLTGQLAGGSVVFSAVNSTDLKLRMVDPNHLHLRRDQRRVLGDVPDEFRQVVSMQGGTARIFQVQSMDRMDEKSVGNNRFRLVGSRWSTHD